MTAEELARIIGKRLTTYRTNKELSRSELASAVDLSVSYISFIERGERLPHLDVLFKLAEALDVPIFHFFADETSFDGVGGDLEFTNLMKPVNTVVQKLNLKHADVLLSARVLWALHAPKGLGSKPPI